MDRDLTRARLQNSSSGVYLGVDAGGSRSTALVVDAKGALLGRADGGRANYQSIGAGAARASLADVVSRALSAAGATPESVVWAGYGIAGADRPKDYAAIQAQLPPVPPIERRTLVNDTELVLRAGTAHGVGVALVAGTGTNAIGRDAAGRLERVGGFCSELGDFGSAGDLGKEALRLAMRGREGRGEPTALYARLCATLGVDPLEDIIDLWMDGDARASDYGALAPLVFETAAAGDAVAKRLLEQAGGELALSARVVLDRLFSPADAVTVVLGGSVLQRGADPTLVATVARELARARAGVRVVRLQVEPVVGAVLLAHDAAPAADSDFPRGLASTFGDPFAVAVRA